MWNSDTLEHILHLSSQREEQTRGQAGIWDYPAERRCGLSLVLPTASSFRLSPANFPMLSILPYLPREVVSFPSPGGEGWVQSRTEEHTADVVEATVFCFCCTSWLRSHGLNSGLHLKMLLNFKELAVVCHPQEGEVCCCMAFSDLCV